MFNLLLVGLNHRTAKVDVRQKASFNAEELPEGLRRLSETPGVQEAMIVSTCNRVEVISRIDPQLDDGAALESFLSEYSGIPIAQLQPTLYRYADEQAVRHLFRVASSLDSMILGEPQILGQLKSCYTTAVDSRTVGAFLNNLLQSAFRIAKRVRSETSIGEYPVSVSSAAVELVRKIFGDLQKKSILIVGAGKMGEAAIRHLADVGAKALYVTNRSSEAATEVASRFNGLAVPFEELNTWVTRVDIVITSTAASDMLIDRSLVQRVMHERKNAPIAFIDISVPRNIDPGIGTIDNVFCYDIDDLAAVVEANLHERVKAAASAEKIIDQEVQAFCAKANSANVGPVVKQVQGTIEDICKTELDRYLRKTGPQEPKQMKELEAMIARIAGKIAHPLVVQLRSDPNSANQSVYMDLINRMTKTKEPES
jgi:glutamyl-tRNA reductase